MDARLKRILDSLAAVLKQIDTILPELFPRPDHTEHIQELPMNKATHEELQEAMYQAAHSFLGKDASPQDVAADAYGCAESVSKIIQKARPDIQFPLHISTRTLYSYLLQSLSFATVTKPSAGDIVLYVTGTGNGKVANGHVGIVGKNNALDGSKYVMSNDSRFGTFEANMTIASMQRFYGDRGGMPAHFFASV